MSTEGSCSDESIEHDDVSSWQHARDKRELSLRKGTDWIGIPSGGEFEFENNFSAFSKEESLYFFFGGIPEVRAEEFWGDEWDKSGTMASYSAGSKIADYREFKRSQNRPRRGRKVGATEELGPPAPPSEMTPLARDLVLDPIDPKTYKAFLRSVRDETDKYHSVGRGAEGRRQWKTNPIATKVKLVEGGLTADLLDDEEHLFGHEPDLAAGPKAKVVEVKTAFEMARATINSNPGLARAMKKLVDAGKKNEVREMMIKSIPRIIRAFEQETGRRVVGLSIHWDSNLPHWNLWHTGLERVLFKKGKGADRVRYRRTAMNLNSSGPGLRAWRRSMQAFDRLGKPNCVPTMTELVKAQKKAMEDQGRLPGDWMINDAADSVLEELLVEGGFKEVVDEGFSEFVANEEKRYAAGVAGKVSRMEKEVLATELRDLQKLVTAHGIELDELKAAASVGSAIQKLFNELLVMLKKHPRVLAVLRKPTVLRDFFQNLADLLKVDVNLVPKKMEKAVIPVIAVLAEATVGAPVPVEKEKAKKAVAIVPKEKGGTLEM